VVHQQLQLGVLTTLMLGDHERTGRVLAAYAAVMDMVREHVVAGSWRRDRLRKKRRARLVALLTDHFEMAEYVSHILLSYGRSHEFGDYHERAAAVYDEVFGTASAAVEDFYRRATASGRTVLIRRA
jgi:hypothetical protein